MIKKVIFSTMVFMVLLTSCSSDDDNNIIVPTNSELTLNLNGLEPLGIDYVYDGWIIVKGEPISTGTFSSVTFPQTFSVNRSQLTSATMFVLSIEPAIDIDPAPAETKILAGVFSGSSAQVDSNSIVGDFSSSSGTYILATPTDMDDTNEASGVWFLDNSGSSPMTGLNLPELQNGWKYEGWAVIDGMPVSTGTFTSVMDFDDNAENSPYKGDSGNGPSFSGEDYLQNAPIGLSFPTDLRGTTVVISVEPYPDNSPMPFTLKPLAHMVPNDAMVHSAITMNEGPTVSLSGTVTR